MKSRWERGREIREREGDGRENDGRLRCVSALIPATLSLPGSILLACTFNRNYIAVLYQRLISVAVIRRTVTQTDRMSVCHAGDNGGNGWLAADDSKYGHSEFPGVC